MNETHIRDRFAFCRTPPIAQMHGPTTRRNALAAVLFAASIFSGCANAPTQQVLSAPRRDLTAAEKTAIASVISRNLKDPKAAKFLWMPVVLSERDTITDYCGLVNGKNSYGGYTGFVRFYAQLQKNGQGQKPIRSSGVSP